MKRIINNILLQRKKLLESQNITIDCPWFDSERIKGLGDLVKILYHPDAIQFCMENCFPSYDVFKQFKSMNVERYGVYIDAGEITLTNIERVYLIGNTSANITCSRGRSKIIATHGASASVIARGYSVVEVISNGDGKVAITHLEKARVRINSNGKWVKNA